MWCEIQASACFRQATTSILNSGERRHREKEEGGKEGGRWAERRGERDRKRGEGEG